MSLKITRHSRNPTTKMSKASGLQTLVPRLRERGGGNKPHWNPNQRYIQSQVISPSQPDTVSTTKTNLIDETVTWYI